MNTLVTFIIIIFGVAFVSDVILNDLSRGNYINSVSALKPYFEKRSIFESGVYAGLTILAALLPTILLFYLLKQKWIPSTFHELLIKLFIASPVGYFLDIVIHKFKIFGNDLDPYYEAAGAGFWGATAFDFAIIVTYIIIKLFIQC